MIESYVLEIEYHDPLSAYACFKQQNGAIFLDSAGRGRYSFIAVDPFCILKQGNPFSSLADALKKFNVATHPGLPPFQGGMAGFISYDALHYLEKIPRHRLNDMSFSDFVFGVYDLVLAYDHSLKRAWIFSSGLPEVDTKQRMQRAEKRAVWFRNEIAKAKSLSIAAIQSGPLQSNFTPSVYQAAVRKVKEYILNGDIFQANISQRFKAPFYSHPFDLYQRLRAINPSPFSAYLHFDNEMIVSASPERFLKLSDHQVFTSPIKGTRPRGKNETEDKHLANELLHSEKDRAENTMIVDLLRNDLSRVCEPLTVSVPRLCGLESFSTVHHLVSDVTGKLQAEYTAVDLLKAAFPGGSVTGAPKIRAMEIIAEIEPTTRGPYCGSIGYLGFNGDMDFSITIRTFAIKDQQLTFQAGGAIVLESDPENEYEETLTKAKALHDSIN